MKSFRDKLCVGILGRGNPYLGNLEQGIAYDNYEINHPLVQQSGDYPLILGGYQLMARKLIDYLLLKNKSKVLEIGSGTGIATLELLLKNPETSVICVEDSEGMIDVARYKFNQSEGTELIKQVNDNKLLTYWNEFRLKSSRFKDQVEFIKANFHLVKIEQNSIDYAIASSSLYHTNLSVSFKQLYEFLKENRYIIWDGSSHSYNDEEFSAKKYGFRYNDFLGFVLDEVSKRTSVLGDYRNLSLPIYTHDSLKEITLKEGFKTEKIALHLTYTDLQIFIKDFIPPIVKELTGDKLDDEEFKNILDESIAKAINNPKSLNDTTHKYGIKPIFKSTKI